MPWKECCRVSEREEFVRLLERASRNVSTMCRRYGISRKTGYKWLARYGREGMSGLSDRSRRPHDSPRRTSEAVERAVLAVRASHPAWGGRKIRRVLQNHGEKDVPAASTITMILYRHGLIDQEESSKHKAYTRFERRAPNELWQMDFKGHFALGDRRCHPLTVLDDHSRYCVGLQACGDERGATVRDRLTRMFRVHGLPRQMLMDNGAPWGGDWNYPWTSFTVWLIQLDVRVSHGRPYHPQTQGKDERFHRTLQTEVLNRHRPSSFSSCQTTFDEWRQTYNLHRPHEALDLDVPVSRYWVSSRAYPETLPSVEHGPGDQVRKVQGKGEFHFRGKVYVVGRAFHGHRIGLRPSEIDGVWDVYFCHQRIARLDERTRTCECRRQGGGDGISPGCQPSVRSAHTGPAAGGVPRHAGRP